MLPKEILQRFLDACECENELYRLTNWLSIGVCPKCQSEDIELEYFLVDGDDGEIIEEAIHCYCQRPTCYEYESATLPRENDELEA